LEALIQRLQHHQVEMLLLIGGNGTMAAAHAIAQAAAAVGHPLRVAGIPKTIDNDLPETDAAPGYGSAARFVAETARAIGLDLRAMVGYDQVAIFEVMGRHTGWLAGAAALARSTPDDPPHLIVLPEAPFDEGAFLARVQDVQRMQGVCLVVAAEGLRDAQGQFLAEKGQTVERDASGQRMLSLAGVAPYLAGRIRAELGLLCRQMRPDTIQRSCHALASPVDRTLATQVGQVAVAALLTGQSDCMVALQRTATMWTSILVPLAAVLGRERAVPANLLHPAGFDVTSAFQDYAAPLAGELSPPPLLL
jgi:6-phosphofructokinase 1